LVRLAWQVPEGLPLENAVAEVAFVVDKDGRLVGEPVVVKHASDPEVALSGIRAIKAVGLFPPLPAGFEQQRVISAFTLVR
jgi:hypothetical protein